MSRYQLSATDGNHEVIVGWDNPLETYFINVRDTRTTEDEDDRFVLQRGNCRQEIPTVTDLIPLVSPYASVPEKVALALSRDYAERTRPTPLQERMIAMMERHAPSRTERDR